MRLMFKDHPEFAKWCQDKWGTIPYSGLLVKEGRGYWIRTEEQSVRKEWMWLIKNGTVGLFQYLQENYPEALI